jgi:KDO2-lipid IV(A) lauroyltransferase
MIGRLLGSKYPLAAMYRPHKNRLIAHVQERFRQKYKIRNIEKHRMREVINSLHENLALWYAYDIDAGSKHGVFAPFFGVQTSSLKTVSKLIKLTDATVIPIDFFRTDENFGYELTLAPALEDFPGTDLVADATRMNAHLERAIRKKPEQYIWQYKRFKTRPAGEKRFY